MQHPEAAFLEWARDLQVGEGAPGKRSSVIAPWGRTKLKSWHFSPVIGGSPRAQAKGPRHPTSLARGTPHLQCRVCRCEARARSRKRAPRGAAAGKRL